MPKDTLSEAQNQILLQKDESAKHIPLGTPKEWHRIRSKSIHDSMISGLNDFSVLPEEPPDISEHEKSLEDKLQLKDNGYGWVIIFSFFFMNLTISGLVMGLGLITASMVGTIHGATPVAIGFIASLAIGLQCSIGPLVIMVSRYIGTRNCIILGAFIASMGLFITAISSSIILMIVGLGGMVGIGCCMMVIPQLRPVAQYFSKKLSAATGIRMAGYPLGGVVLPPLIVFLIENYGLRHALVYISAIYAHNCILASLIRPFGIHKKISINKYNKNYQHHEKIDDIFNFDKGNKSRDGKDKLKVKLYRDVTFICYSVSSFLRSLTFPLLFYFLPFWVNAAGMTPYDCSIVISIASLVDFFIRLGVGFLCDRININKGGLIAFGLIMGGIAAIFIPFTYSILPMAFLMIIFQFSMATYHVLFNVILSEKYDPDMAGLVFSITRMFYGVGCMVFPSLLGFIWQWTGSFHILFGIMGGASIISGIAMAITPLLVRCTGAD